jgi:hypothetical protein
MRRRFSAVLALPDILQDWVLPFSPVLYCQHWTVQMTLVAVYFVYSAWELFQVHFSELFQAYFSELFRARFSELFQAYFSGFFQAYFSGFFQASFSGFFQARFSPVIYLACLL